MACQLEPDSVVAKIKANLKQNFYPAEECLKICHKYSRTEACAILCKFVGQYRESVKYYTALINTSINTGPNINAFKKELYNLDKHIRVTLLKQKKLLSDKQEQERLKMEQNLNQVVSGLDLGNFQ